MIERVPASAVCAISLGEIDELRIAASESNPPFAASTPSRQWHCQLSPAFLQIAMPLRFAGLERQLRARRYALLAHRQDHGNGDVRSGDRGQVHHLLLAKLDRRCQRSSWTPPRPRFGPVPCDHLCPFRYRTAPCAISTPPAALLCAQARGIARRPRWSPHRAARSRRCRPAWRCGSPRHRRRG